MTETDPLTPDDQDDDDLLQALQAAFGDDATGLLDDTDVESLEPVAESADGEIKIGDSIDANSRATAECDEESVFCKLMTEIGDAVSTDDTTGLTAALSRNQPPEETNRTRHVVFEVGKKQFAVPLTGVVEIARCGNVTELPRTPSWLRGVTNFRGQILSVTDLRILLELAATESEERRTLGEKIIVVHSKSLASSTAIAVDRILGIRSLKAVQHSPTDFSDRIVAFACGFAETEKETTALIDPDSLLGCPELLEFAS